MGLYKNGKKIAGLYVETGLEHSTEAHAGIIQIANNQEVLEGVNDSKAITPKKMKDTLSDVAYSGEFDELLGKPTKLTDFNDDMNISTHISNDTVHVTANDKIAWSKKQNKLNQGANITLTPQEDGTVTISASGALAEVNWGGITGELSNQTDLQNALDNKTQVIIRSW